MDSRSVIIFIYFLNHYAPVSQANCNMNFTAVNLFPSHSCIGVTQVKPPPVFQLWSPAWEVDNLLTELSPYCY